MIECGELSSRELSYQYGRLIKQKQDEEAAAKKQSEGQESWQKTY